MSGPSHQLSVRLIAKALPPASSRFGRIRYIDQAGRGAGSRTVAAVSSARSGEVEITDPSCPDGGCEKTSKLVAPSSSTPVIETISSWSAVLDISAIAGADGLTGKTGGSKASTPCGNSGSGLGTGKPKSLGWALSSALDASGKSAVPTHATTIRARHFVNRLMSYPEGGHIEIQVMARRKWWVSRTGAQRTSGT